MSWQVRTCRLSRRPAQKGIRLKWTTFNDAPLRKSLRNTIIQSLRSKGQAWWSSVGCAVAVLLRHGQENRRRARYQGLTHHLESTPSPSKDGLRRGKQLAVSRERYSILPDPYQNLPISSLGHEGTDPKLSSVRKCTSRKKKGQGDLLLKGHEELNLVGYRRHNNGEGNNRTSSSIAEGKVRRDQALRKKRARLATIKSRFQAARLRSFRCGKACLRG